ncbi:molybdopterin-dependent oxidoreductase [uncultured Tateyamaria sp.]|uniref:molybdopterin-dependent oxidoreductase n=1 Tax=uncultured Tateyamaria sp. TaxID=455651 RepID=UPI00261E8FF3|nr:molybdopterin-dependent oxidoreductase [uncultured Tateyamaria sp.]
MRPRFTAAHWGAYEIHGTGAATKLAPLPRDPHPARIGGGWLDAMRNTDTRIARPAIRAGWLKSRDRKRAGDAPFVQVPWDEALDIVAEELKRIVDTHGNSALYAGSYGWAAAGRFHHAQSQMRRFLNTIGGYVSSANTYSHAAAEVILPHIVGLTNRGFLDQTTSWPLVAQHCELLVAFGGISKRAAQVTSSGTSVHETQDWLDRARARGCHIVNISPLRSDVDAEGGAEWIAPRPGTDSALMLALAHELFVTGKANRDFLSRCTNGAEVFEAYIMGSDGTPKTAEWAAEICDIPSDTIRDLAARMAHSKTMINLAWALQRADHGELTLWAGLALACVLGQIGRPGTGFAFGYGSHETVGRPRKLIDWPSVPQGTNPVSDFIPVARLADMLANPGQAYTYNGEHRRYPDTKMIWWSGGNPFHHHQDLARLDTLWQRPDTVVVMDHSWTATARRADIVLPTTSALERDDLMINRRDPALVYMSAAMPPLGEARDDYDIFAALASRMGTKDAFTEGRSAQEWHEALWQDCAGVAEKNGFDLPTFDAFRQVGLFDVPDTAQERLLFKDFVDDPEANRLNTTGGRIEIESAAIAQMGLADCPAHPVWREPAEWLGQAQPDQLHLILGQPDTRLHAQNDSGSTSKASKTVGRETCTIHPQVAQAHGLENGDVVLLENARGACLAGVQVSDALRPDTVALPTGAWLDLRVIDGKPTCIHGNPNMLTLDKGSTGLSQGNIAHTALVRLRKWDGPLPEITVHRQPVFVES